MAGFKRVDDAAFEKARTRGRRAFAGPRAKAVKLDERARKIVIGFETGPDLVLDPKAIDALRTLRFEDLVGAGIEGAGSVVHFPRIDVDLAIPPLIGARNYDIGTEAAEV